MQDSISLIFYVLIFLALYSQVFFLFAFVEKRKEINKKNIDIKEIERDGNLPSITCIIPCWNEEKTIVKTMSSLRSSSYPKEKLHFVFVNDGSTDKTLKILERYKTMKNTIILHKENGGKHSALNFALPHIKTELVASFDADTVINKDAFHKIVSYFLNNEKLSAVGGTVLIDNPKTITQKAQNIEYQMFAYSKKVLGLLGGVLVVPGAFSVFKTQSLIEVGGYRQAHNMEDLELTYRLQVAGHLVDHAHDAIVYTKGPDSIKSLFKQRMRWSYGFINNTIDYRHVIFNKKFGNFGVFTVPVGMLAYVTVLSVFFITWYKIFQFLIQKFIAVKLVGTTSVFNSLFNLDWFFVNTEALVFLSVLVYGFIFISIYFGRKLSKISSLRSYRHMIWFTLLYSVIVPFWILKSIYNTILSVRPSWR